ncbi:MAG: hypothetical protein EA381_19680 [Planctomycetaceae bacterium]|nr:MAG: hypothetical protein EA381_19680 [Planctomycetaceae bacterium]
MGRSSMQKGSLSSQALLGAAQSFHGEMAASWEALGSGGPTLSALAAVCARAIVDPVPADQLPEFCPEALAILYVARHRGVIEVRGVRTAFEAPGRLLAVYVEEDATRTIAFRNQESPQVTVRFFEGFCQLCRAGMILHHLHRDFTLSRSGFERAAQIRPEEVAEGIAEATEFGLHES